jgi:cysteine desulfurase/selenocysteine lyase
MTPDWAEVRSHFPALHRWTFLNTASFGQLPDAAVAACACHFAHRDELACHDFVSWFDDADRLRGLLGQLIHAPADSIAFAANAAAALAVLLHGIDWRPGDRVVTLAGEFPLLPYAAYALARYGVEAVETSWERLPDLLSGLTRLVLVSTVNYTTGFAPPLDELAGELRRREILWFLDATQSLGALPLDVARLQPTMLAADGYKWLLCPNGAAFFHVPAEVRAWLRPNAVGWRSDRGWRDVDRLHHGAPRLPESAERYEAGMLAFPLLYAMEASVRMIVELGPEVIAQRVLSLAAAVRETVRRPGGIADEQASGIVAARFPSHDASALARTLAGEGILVAARHGYVRISPHFYNNEDDIGKLGGALRRIL